MISDIMSLKSCILNMWTSSHFGFQDTRYKGLIHVKINLVTHARSAGFAESLWQVNSFI
jgi:hypothetical protein